MRTEIDDVMVIARGFLSRERCRALAGHFASARPIIFSAGLSADGRPTADHALTRFISWPEDSVPAVGSLRMLIMYSFLATKGRWEVARQHLHNRVNGG